MTLFRRRTRHEEPPPPKKPCGLNPHQRRALNSTLSHLEQQMLHLEELLRAEPSGVLIRQTGLPSLATRQYLLDHFGHLRQEMTLLAADHVLPGTEEDLRSTLLGTASVLWSDLEDIRPHALARYGAVDPALEGTLGPAIEHLIQGVLAIESIVKAEEARDV